MTSGVIGIIFQEFTGHDALFKFLDKDMFVLTLALSVKRELIVV